ncbi:hypothetical protein L0P44_14550, partial [Streptococcus gordonii]|nr:hypothetical protein [Streptococcus gordonii]
GNQVVSIYHVINFSEELLEENETQFQCIESLRKVYEQVGYTGVYVSVNVIFCFSVSISISISVSFRLENEGRMT